MTKKEYLGDSVYAEFDGHYLTLTTDNGVGPSNTIHMDREVVWAFAKFVSRLNEIQKAGMPTQLEALKE